VLSGDSGTFQHSLRTAFPGAPGDSMLGSGDGGRWDAPVIGYKIRLVWSTSNLVTLEGAIKNCLNYFLYLFNKRSMKIIMKTIRILKRLK
jgi:hypothetical protein